MTLTFVRDTKALDLDVDLESPVHESCAVCQAGRQKQLSDVTDRVHIPRSDRTSLPLLDEQPHLPHRPTRPAPSSSSALPGAAWQPAG